METKKNATANLERKRTIFFELGLVVALALVFFAFEWSTTKIDLDVPTSSFITQVEVDYVPITRPEEPKIEQPKPEPIPEPKPQIEIVDNTVETNSDPDNFNSEGEGNVIFDPGFVEDKKDEIVDDVDIIVDLYKLSEQPGFPGGEAEMFRYIVDNMVYPEDAIDADIEGRVFVSFVVNKKGKVTDVEIERGFHPLLDKEARRIVESMPDWTPGEQMGKKVSSRFMLPINFQLQ